MSRMGKNLVLSVKKLVEKSILLALKQTYAPMQKLVVQMKDELEK